MLAACPLACPLVSTLHCAIAPISLSCVDDVRLLRSVLCRFLFKIFPFKYISCISIYIYIYVSSASSLRARCAQRAPPVSICLGNTPSVACHFNSIQIRSVSSAHSGGMPTEFGCTAVAFV
uniref:Putative secreted protein n=1 Tax=Anopheles marajoara TaxID=58244 RepID=A0A2M4C7B8_9DIPT